MALYQELTGQGRVVGGHLAGGTVFSGRGGFSKNGDLSIQHSSNPFKRHKINAETITEWEELDPRKGLAGAMGQAAARAALPGAVGKAVGASLGAAFDSGHTLRVVWADGKQSVVELPEKQFMVLSILLKDCQVIPETPAESEEAPPAAGMAGKIADLASTAFARRRQAAEADSGAPAPDPAEQIAKLASLHAQGLITDTEFSDKKAELLKRF
ncbi:SHOCT domain-containing protein [Nocardioides marmorisolisilvae]|uniref:SHOCT domain-containing protein n=1 Tax=Nocardioides marmorisolisilvae TaxID=1542737 RepID=A0A3N0DSK1_9ACTN|nr:SHOCT domain-containing protein [Nocardioides marmorisolisilvae]RNL78491.1 SHOCT domain-containing protein [Nocardioides marmorisolisilvae]